MITKTIQVGTNFYCRYCGKDLGEERITYNSWETDNGMQCDCELAKKEIEVKNYYNNTISELDNSPVPENIINVKLRFVCQHPVAKDFVIKIVPV